MDHVMLTVRYKSGRIDHQFVQAGEHERGLLEEGDEIILRTPIGLKDVDLEWFLEHRLKEDGYMSCRSIHHPHQGLITAIFAAGQRSAAQLPRDSN